MLPTFISWFLTIKLHIIILYLITRKLGGKDSHTFWWIYRCAFLVLPLDRFQSQSSKSFQRTLKLGFRFFFTPASAVILSDFMLYTDEPSNSLPSYWQSPPFHFTNPICRSTLWPFYHVELLLWKSEFWKWLFHLQPCFFLSPTLTLQNLFSLITQSCFSNPYSHSAY